MLVFLHMFIPFKTWPGCLIIALYPVEMNGKTLGSSKGSGTLIHSDGTILTCAHLVSDCHGRKVTSKRKVGAQNHLS